LGGKVKITDVGVIDVVNTDVLIKIETGFDIGFGKKRGGSGSGITVSRSTSNQKIVAGLNRSGKEKQGTENKK